MLKPSKYIFSLLIVSCSRNACPLKANKQQFRNHLSIISSYEKGRRSVLVDDYRKSISFLYLITGIESKADYSSTFGYRNRADYKEDMRLWKKWYRRNRCKLTDQYIDSAIARKQYKPQ